MRIWGLWIMRKPKSKTFSKDERKEIALYSGAMGVDAALKKYGIGTKKLYAIRKEFDIKRDSRKDAYLKAMNDVQHGMSYSKAAKKHDVSVGTLHRMVKKEAEECNNGIHPALMLPMVLQ